jgi:hypothetical protein
MTAFWSDEPGSCQYHNFRASAPSCAEAGIEMFDPTVQISLFRKLKLANCVTISAIAKAFSPPSAAAIRRLRARSIQ